MNKDYKITVTFKKYDNDPIETASVKSSGKNEEEALHKALEVLYIKDTGGVISVLTEEIEEEKYVIREIT